MSPPPPNCSGLATTDLLVGPQQVYSSLGGWTIPMVTLLGLHFLPVIIFTIVTLRPLRQQVHPLLVPPLTWLVCLPASLLTLTSLGILFPGMGKYLELLLEVCLCIGMVRFVQLSLAMCGGPNSVVQHCLERDTDLPLGSPPFICFIPFPKPRVSTSSLALICLAPSLLLATKATILAVEVSYLALGYTEGGDFLAWDNLHNIASFPAGLFGIYFYNMFMSLINGCMGEHGKRNIGIILLIQFILFDCLRLFFTFLSGTGMLTCVPPFLNQGHVEHILKNIIKAFLSTGLGLAFLRLCQGKTGLIPQLVQRDFPSSTSSQLGVLRQGAQEGEEGQKTGMEANGVVSNLRSQPELEAQRSI